jgi:hypothetical protein
MFINGENVVVVNNDDSPRYFDDVEYCVGEEYKESWYEGDGDGECEYGGTPVAVICNTKTLYSQNVCVSDDTHPVLETLPNDSVDERRLDMIFKFKVIFVLCFIVVGLSSLGTSIIFSTT